ncbi:hypothetical protein TWF281_011231 [Arthrobotrys megalospora]
MPPAPQLPEAWDRGDDWTGLTGPAERRRRQNRLNQRAWRKRRHQNRLTLDKRTLGSDLYDRQSVAVETQTWEPTGPEEGAHLVTATNANDSLFGKLALFLIVRWPGLQRSVFEFLKTAMAHWMLNHPNPRDLPSLSRLNAFDALARNSLLLCIPYEFLETDEFSSPFNYYGPLEESSSTRLSLPKDLSPTILQKNIIHHSWLDLFPFPSLRDNILLGILSGQLDEDQLCDEICCDLLNLDAESVPSLMVWGDSWDSKGWEFSESFFHKWGVLLQGCPEVFQATNYWREERGDARVQDVTN